VSENALLLSVATVVARLSGFALAVVMGRRLGPAGYGVYGYAAALGFVLVPIADLGLTPYLTREVARDPTSGEALVERVLRIRLATSIGLVTLVALAAVITGSSSQTLLVIVLVVGAALVDGLATVFYGYFAGRERMALEATLSAVTAVLRAVGGIAIMLATGDLVPAAAWILAVGLGQLAWASSRTSSGRTHPRRPPPPITWRTALSLGFTAIAVMAYLRADTVLVGWILSDRDVGWYAAAYTLLLGVQVVPHMIGRALFPVFARTWAGDQRDAFVASWRRGVRAVLLIALPISIVISVLAGPIVERFFGDGFAPAGAALAVLVWSSPLAALNTVAFGALRGAGRDSLLTRVSLAAAAGNVVVNLWAIPAYGIRGAAVVTVVTEALILVAQTAPAISTGLLPFPKLPYGRLGVALAVLAVVAMAVRGAAVETALAACLATYAAALLATGAARPAELAGRTLAWRRRG
jgi:O-antigen/teichoic acid export membrane protein